MWYDEIRKQTSDILSVFNILIARLTEERKTVFNVNTYNQIKK